MKMEWILAGSVRLLLICTMVVGLFAFGERVYGKEIEKTQTDDMTIDFPDLQEIETLLDEMIPEYGISFENVLETMRQGDYKTLLKKSTVYLRDIVEGEVLQNKALLVQILLLMIVFSILRNFADVFSASKVSEMGFFVVFFVLLLLLAHSFTTMNQLAQQTLENLNLFMRTLMPVFAGTVLMSGAPQTAFGYGELTIFLIYLVELCMEHIVLPIIHGFFVAQCLNYITNGELLNSFGEVLGQTARWMMKAAAIAVFGMSIIQNMVAPAMDHWKMLSSRKAMTMLPGIGLTTDTITQMMIGSGTVLKSCVGMTGVIVIAAFCLLPVIKIWTILFLYKITAMLAEPVADKRMVGILKKTSEAMGLILRMVFTVAGMFMTTLAVVVAVQRG